MHRCSYFICKRRTTNVSDDDDDDETLRYFGKITAFDENHGFRDFRVSVIFYCP